ncbi:MAG: ABC-type glycerol-3-phosphate transport system [Verrucomicrobia bacterium]|jgi:ABC-type glycerol-3-phosphate transport system substrate-binding protein|nr:MAG: ABC-type glycerol-3-phosphate transport system [Verrucomicrobiota bacterium]
MRRLRAKLGLALLVGAYAGALYWVLTRSEPVIHRREVTIYFAHWQIERGPPDGINAAIKRYEELNPRVHVVQLQIPGATIYPQWMRSNLAGETGPDLMEWGAWLPGQKDIPARYFAPLTAELAKPNPYNRGTSQEKIPWQDTFHDKLLAPKRDSPDPGQIYAVNITESTLRLFCNVELMKEILGRVVVPKNFDDLRKIFAQVQDYSRRTGRTIHGLAGSRDTTRSVAQSVILAPLLGVNQRLDDGGTLYLYNRQVLAAYLAGRWRYSEPAVRAGLQLVRETTNAMKPGFIQLRRDDAMIEFLRGQALFFFYGTWDATSLRRLASFKIQPMKLMQAMPDDPEVGRYVVGQGGEGMGETSLSMYLNKTSRHPAEALDFLKFLTSVPGQQLFTDASLWLPAVNGAVVPEAIRNFRDYQEGISFGQAPYDMIGTEVGMNWDRNFYRLSGENGSAEKFAAALDAEMPAAVRQDLKAELRATLVLVKPQDPVIVGWAGLTGDKARIRREESEAAQTMSEGLALQMKLQLESAK